MKIDNTIFSKWGRGVVYILIVVAIVLCFSMGMYLNRIGKMVDRKTSSYLDEIASQVNSNIVTSDGDIVIRSNHKNFSFTESNIIDLLGSTGSINDETLQQVQEDMKNGLAGKIEYSSLQKEQIATYYPINNGNWYVFTTTTSSNLIKDLNGFFKLGVIFCLFITLILGVLFITIFIICERSQRVVAKMAFTDDLTGGLSKKKFEIDAMHLIKNNPNCYTLVYANIQKFKRINELIGQGNADKLICHVHHVIKSDIGEGELLARLTADQFVMLLYRQDLSGFKRRIARWNAGISGCDLLSESTANVSMNYGLYNIDEKGLSIYEMIDCANLASQNIPLSDNETIHFAVYDNELKEKLLSQMELEERQEGALQNGEFVVYLQPKYEVKDEKIVGAEALVRWITPDKGMICPDKFIPLFECNGFITKLDLYVFEQICVFQKQMKEQGIPQMPISVNLSRVQLSQKHFIREYVEIAQKYEVDTHLLELEITETVFSDDVILLSEVIKAIRGYGFKVSLDDFGSGYSSLNMLSVIVIDVLKLDRCFFEKSITDHRNITIIKSIIDLAKKLNMEVVAEGIEKKEQLDILKKFGCHYVQGYYYSGPKPFQEFLKEI